MKLTKDKLTEIVDSLREISTDEEANFSYWFEVEFMTNDNRPEMLDRMLAISEYSAKVARLIVDEMKDAND